jgi:hypothetical protein
MNYLNTHLLTFLLYYLSLKKCLKYIGKMEKTGAVAMELDLNIALDKM